MKKIILLLTIFLLTGCYDYKEINDLALVSLIALDYDNKYLLSFEILDNNDTSYIVNDTGKTIEETFDNINLKIGNKAYFNHLKVLLISENIAKDHLKDIIDYITRNPNIRNEFYIVVCNNTNDILNIKNDNIKIKSKYISNLIKSNYKTNIIQSDKVYEDFLESIVNPYTYGITLKIKNDNNDIVIDGISVFNDYKYIETLNNDQSSLINLLVNNCGNIILNKDNISIKVNNIKVKYKINKDSVILDIKAYASILSNDKNIRNEDNFIKLNNEFSILLEDKFNNLLNYLNDNNLDILGIDNKYYQKYKIIKNKLNDYNIKINTNLIINKKGLTFNE